MLHPVIERYGADFDPEKHPRGQPDNAGQFAPANETAGESHRLPSGFHQPGHKTQRPQDIPELKPSADGPAWSPPPRPALPNHGWIDLPDGKKVFLGNTLHSYGNDSYRAQLEYARDKLGGQSQREAERLLRDGGEQLESLLAADESHRKEVAETKTKLAKKGYIPGGGKECWDALEKELRKQLGEPDQSSLSEAKYFFTPNGRSIRLATHPPVYNFEDSGIGLLPGVESSDAPLRSEDMVDPAAVVKWAIEENSKLSPVDVGGAVARLRSDRHKSYAAYARDKVKKFPKEIARLDKAVAKFQGSPRFAKYAEWAKLPVDQLTKPQAAMVAKYGQMEEAEKQAAKMRKGLESWPGNEARDEALYDWFKAYHGWELRRDATETEKLTFARKDSPGQKHLFDESQVERDSLGQFAEKGEGEESEPQSESKSEPRDEVKPESDPAREAHKEYSRLVSQAGLVPRGFDEWDQSRKQTLAKQRKIASKIPEFGTTLSKDDAATLIQKIRAGDKRSKNQGRESPEFVEGPMTVSRVPVSLFDRPIGPGETYLDYLRGSTSSTRVAEYAGQEIDTPIVVHVNRKGLPVISDGGHRLMAAIQRGDREIPAIVPEALHHELHGDPLAARYDEYTQAMKSAKIEPRPFSEWKAGLKQQPAEAPKPSESPDSSSGPDPVTEPTTPQAAAEQSAKSESPRKAATAVTKAMDPEYAYARKSEVGNFGEDIKSSARHNRNEWKGLDHAESEGTAANLVTRENLLKNEPHKLSATIENSSAYSHLAAHLAINAFPKDPGEYPKNYDRYRTRTGAPTTPAKSPEDLRKQYFEAYKTLKESAQEIAESERDPATAVKKMREVVSRMIEKYREQTGSGLMAQATAKDLYNPVANGLVDTYNRLKVSTYGRHKANSVMGRVVDFQARAKSAYGDEAGENLTGHVIDVMEGKSFNATFGTTEGGPKRFNPSEAYVSAATRKGGRKIDTSTVEAGRRFMMDRVGLRGVQWGNSVSDDERLHHLTKSSEALADLADATGLPDSALSLGGKLGFAIGARGRAGARAHYEPDTTTINLTRSSGVGSLAHEWGHGLDHCLGGFQGDFLSQAKGTSPLHSAMGKVKTAFHESGFLSRLREEVNSRIRAGTLGKNAMEYWTSHVELFARCFERHIQNKLHGDDRENTYLTGLHKAGHPLWPNNEEMAKISPHLDGLLTEAAKSFESEQVAKEKFSLREMLFHEFSMRAQAFL